MKWRKKDEAPEDRDVVAVVALIGTISDEKERLLESELFVWNGEWWTGEITDLPLNRERNFVWINEQDLLGTIAP